MKRKLFSAILFGALLTASTSGLTSCKDYDDDISNLQSQIDKLATAEQLSTKVSELQTAIAQAKSDAIDAANAAKQVADNALKAAQDAATKGDVEAAKAAADAAQKTVDDLKASGVSAAAINAAQEAADKANAAIADAIEKGTPVIEGLNKAIEDLKAAEEEHTKAINDLDKQLNGEGGIAERLAAAEKAIEEGANIDLTELTKLIEDFEAEAKEILGTALVMVTDVHLFNPDADFDSNALTFAQVKELVDLKFPANGEADGYAEFKKDAYKMYGDSLVVRVSPIEAELKPENITLINSQGAEVSSDVLEVTDVVRYTRNKPLTRAVDDANGLWVVKFKVADEVKAEDFEKIAGKNEEGKQVLFAVAVNNTDEVSGSRRVISDYDVTLAYSNAEASSNLFVNGISIYKNNFTDEKDQYNAGIHNRFNKTENTTTLPSAVKGKDKKWKKDANENFIPALEVVDDPANYEKDDRDNSKVLLVKEGEDIAISYPSDQPIKGFYVALDWTRACESGESELNAWNSYKYENVAKFAATGVLIEAGKFFEGNNGTIKVAALSEAQRLAGDIIGFRVFAVNLDGTLVDPDGQAFYVGIQGSETTDNVELAAAEAEVTKVASQANGKNWTGAIDFAPAKEGMSDVSLGTWTVEGAPQGANETFRNNTEFAVKTLDKNGNQTGTFKDIVAVKIQLKDPTAFVDGATYTFKTTLKKNVSGAEYTVRNVAVKVTKKMPGVPTNIKFSGDEDKYQPIYDSNNTYTGINVGNVGTSENPVSGNTTPIVGKLKLGTFLVYDNATNAPIDSYGDYSYTISKAKYSWDNTDAEWKLEADEVGSGDSWILPVISMETRPSDKYTYLVDCSTTHTIKSNYSYGDISYRWDKDLNRYDVKEWKPATLQTPEVVFMSWASQNSGFTTYKIAKYSNKKTGNEYKECTFNEIAWTRQGSTMNIGAASNAPWDVNNATDRLFSLNNIRVKFGLKVLNMAQQPFSRTSTSLGNLLLNGYLKLIDAWTEVPAADGSVDKNKFVKPTVNRGKNDITLQQVANMSADHTEILKLQVVDCFNYKQVIEVPISIVTTVSGDVEKLEEITFK